MFPNSAREPNKVSTRSQLLHTAKAARDARKDEKKRHQSAIVLQAHIRRYQTQCRLRQDSRQKFDDTVSKSSKEGKFLSATEVFQVNQRLLFVYKKQHDAKRLVAMCQYITASMDVSNNLKVWYVSLALSKKYILRWVEQIKKIICLCWRYIDSFQTQDLQQQQEVQILLQFILKITDCTDWKQLSAKGGDAIRPTVTQLCSKLLQSAIVDGLYPTLGQLLMQCSSNSKLTTRKAIVPTSLTLAIRPLVQSSYSKPYVQLFIQHIWAVPALSACAQATSPFCVELLSRSELIESLVKMMGDGEVGLVGLESMNVNSVLSMAGNFIETSVQCGFLHSHREQFLTTVCRLFGHVRPTVAERNTQHTHWHPVVGLLKEQQNSDKITVPFPVTHLFGHGFHLAELQLLWHPSTLEILFPLFPESEASRSEGATVAPKPNLKLGFVSRLKKRLNTMFQVSLPSSAVGSLQLDPTRWRQLHNACRLYELAMSTLTELRGEILSAISFHELLPQQLWQSLQCVGGGFSSIINMAVRVDSKLHVSICSLLTLICKCCYHLIAILDDVEVYVRQKPFALKDLTLLSSFLNELVFQLLWEVPNVTDPQFSDSPETRLMNAAHTLLMVLYEKDSRRPFSENSSQWIIKDLKASTLQTELSRNQPRAKAVMKRVPHILPYKERVKILRDRVIKDKQALGLVETVGVAPRPCYIRIHRSRFLEDAYSQLCQLTAVDLKGIIRVKFINEQGLDEPGIDQDGVFKEFLEDTIKRVFDPSLTLFKATVDQRLYPSPNSVAQDNYQALFNFVGRMLGKAVYEGFLVDVPFADFFLTNLKGTKYSAAYSPFDELASFDTDLYKNLSYVKHYEGDVSELDLSLSVNREFFGKVETYDLVPGGRAVPVTNENKISYIHRVAQFHMCTELQHQTTAFVRGFHSIVNPEWLGYFSPREIQQLISGGTVELDIQDLKKHVEYLGGFHPGHQIVRWLWDVICKDFTAEEKALFLKFVTGCSKPPVLGFAHLNPPFAIRFVETSDDTDEGDTVGSVLRGFFRRSSRSAATRLPTSSTCFNLLKLPNYPSKAVLRGKLRQAITSASGFELS